MLRKQFNCLLTKFNCVSFNQMTKFSYSCEDFLFSVSRWTEDSENIKTLNQSFHLKVPSACGPFDKLLQTKWDEAKRNGHFRYSLENLESKILPGKYGFVAQLNLLRALQRRKPQVFQSLDQPFDPNSFNFTKIKEEEILFTLHYNDVENKKEESSSRHVVLINVSPLEYCNSLLVPSIDDHLPQILNHEGLQKAIEVILLSATPALRIGFNSLCAYASVNHFHFHLFYLNCPLYLEIAPVKKLTESCYEVCDYAVPGFVLELENFDVNQLITNVMRVVTLLQANNIPHNLFITRGTMFNASLSDSNKFDTVRVYIWPRKPCEDDKDKTSFNVACCELSGHIPVKDEKGFHSISEGTVVKILRESCEDSFYAMKSKLCLCNSK